MSVLTTTGATDRQAALITKIATELGRDADALLIQAHSASAASRIIDGLIRDSKAARVAARAAAPAPVIPGPGYYLANGEVVRVQASKDGGRAYAKRLVGTKFEYAPGLVYRLADATPVTFEVAAAHGHRTGHCMICGRELTREDSIAAGIGPICRGRIG